MSSSSPAPRSSRPGARLPPFYRDLASPISSHHRAGARSAAAAHADDAAAAPWRGGFGGAAPPPPPPPPLFTLDDRVDSSPDPAFGELPPSSPRSRAPPRPDRRSFSRSPSLSSPPSSSALRIRAEASSSGGVGHGATPGAPQSSGRSSWMTPERGTGVNYLEKGKGSPVEGVVEPGALIAHPTNVKEVALAPAPQDPGRESVRNGGLDDEEWITVFGFYPSDTNLVLREFEKCGVILRHLPGPNNSNWIHILYEHRYDARKALEKNGTQLTSALIIGVKSVDLIERQLLNERLNKLNRGGFMVSLPSKPSVKATASSSQLGAFLRPYHPKSNTNAIGDSGRRATGSIASPAQSLVSKVADLVFGL